MDTHSLKGSPARDAFKFWHKQFLPRSYYGCDVDFLIIEKNPSGIVAAIDYKHPLDTISFTEVHAYNHFLRQDIPVYIVTSSDLRTFVIHEYVEGDPVPEPPKVLLRLARHCASPDAYLRWEGMLRDAWRKRCAI